MNSQKKFHEITEQEESLQMKISRKIYQYQVRLAAARCEFKETYDYRMTLKISNELRPAVSYKLLAIQDEINLCISQITAYQQNDNKAKLVPDRLL